MSESREQPAHRLVVTLARGPEMTVTRLIPGDADNDPT
jgi:hypothetical protein